MRMLVALTLAALVSGCLGGAPASKDTVATPSAPSSGASARESLEGAVAPGANSTGVVTFHALAFSYEGRSPTGVCAFGLPVGETCDFSDPGKESVHKVAFTGNATHVAVGITYGAQQPGMAFYGAICTRKDASAAEVACGEYKTSASPLVLEADLKDLAKGAVVEISVGSVYGTPGDTGVLVLGPADFAAKGAITIRD